MLEAIAGADFSWAPGDVVEVSDEEAESWADGHRAVLADGHEAPSSESTLGHAVPLIVGEDGQPLEVVSASVETADRPEDADEGQAWVRWSVTVRLPVPSDVDGQEQGLVDPADLENQDPGDVVPYDPREHTNKEVLAYLDTVGEQEALRVLDLEAASDTPRAGIGKMRDQVLEAARARDAAEGGPEHAAEYSRGGGGADPVETRSW